MDMYVACSGAARASPLTCAHRLIEEQGKEMSDMLTRVCAAGPRAVGLLVHASGFRRSISDYSRSSTKHNTLPLSVPLEGAGLAMRRRAFERDWTLQSETVSHPRGYH